MEPFFPFLVATGVGCAIALFGWYAAKRAGLGPVQAEYVRNLEGNNRMLEKRVELIEDDNRKLREDIGAERGKRAKLAQRVIRLERTVISLAEENDYLRGRLNMPKGRSAERLEPDIDDDDLQMQDPPG